MPLGSFDCQNIDYIMQGGGDWFTAQLLCLIQKADRQNRARLRLGFPEEVALVEQWEKGGSYGTVRDSPTESP